MQFIQINDVSLAVEVAGQGDPLIFVHGFPLDHSMWRAQIEEFSKTHWVIAPDLRGFGQSEDTSGTVSMKQFADDLAAVIQQLGITRPVTLCGLSMGGYIAWQFWKWHRPLLGRLILCDTRAVADSEEARRNRLASSERVLSQGAQFLADSMPEKMFAPQTFTEQPELVEQAQRSILGNSPVGISAALLGMADRPDVTDWLPSIDVPTLVLVGEHDSISPVEEMRAIANAIPGSDFTVIPQAGHMAPGEQPIAFNRAIHSFLR